MKPAPPVTRSLGTGYLFQDSAQALAPMDGSEAVSCQRALVEYAVGRAAGRSRVVCGGNRRNRDIGREQTERCALLGDRHRKVVPAGDSRVGPVMNAAHLGRTCDSPKRFGEKSRRGWCPHL